MNNKLSPIILGLLLGAIVLLIIFGSRMFHIIQPGERAVIFKPYTMGLDKDNIKEAGLTIIAPWNQVIVYEVKEQTREETMDVLDKNSMTINMEITIRFNPMYDKIGQLHEKFGRNYQQVLVIPEVRSVVRSVTGRYTAEELFASKRKEVEDLIEQETSAVLEANNIEMRALLIRSIQLPAQIKEAIESKLKQEQEALAYQFKLDKERSEAERRAIEADGIANYNRIISASLTDNILKQKGIDATLKLAESPNAKVVVIGSGKDGLPMILGNN
ncbi:SPFH domain, Band 7 family protein [Saccharicrinis carchari]|uniref:SPFH domain, Band 7 family protein n=1 Tax=Saccharicrinis carchari TaxID=1168039 RepID=A0A521D416_SACCC|nr:prohibitin family protein [Saccharicrinis carchari]SMO66436.1 SPFH domain, Band 7 family protein [Saccharicrinis carchari]